MCICMPCIAAVCKFKKYTTLKDYSGREEPAELSQVYSGVPNLSAWFITGFTDAEGSFRVSINKDKTYKIGWQVRGFFEITLHEKDFALLELIQKFFGVGKIYVKKENSAISYIVSSVKELEIIREHFEKYPLLTNKRMDFELWAQTLDIIKNKEHLLSEGLNKIVAIRASMNLGLSEELKAIFPCVTPVERMNILDCKIKDPEWFSGFASGEGCFLISIFKNNNLSGFAVKLRFNLIQHSRDTLLMKSMEDYLGCGRYVAGPVGYNHCEFIVSKLSDITPIIIPFFEKYPIKGNKSMDFTDFCKVAQIMQKKGHLTYAGLDQIRLIQSGMNRSRKTDS